MTFVTVSNTASIVSAMIYLLKFFMETFCELKNIIGMQTSLSDV